MPKTTLETRTCKRCNLEHPLTWFRIYKLKDGSKRRTEHCKLCVVGKGIHQPIETWCEKIYKEYNRELSPASRQTVPEPPRRTVRFKYYGVYKSKWLKLRKTLLNPSSSPRTSFLERWALNSNLVYSPRLESTIGHPNGKNLRISDTYDPEDNDSIIITQIKPAEKSTTYETEWSTEDLIRVIEGFKNAIDFPGNIISTIETHIE